MILVVGAKAPRKYEDDSKEKICACCRHCCRNTTINKKKQQKERSGRQGTCNSSEANDSVLLRCGCVDLLHDSSTKSVINMIIAIVYCCWIFIAIVSVGVVYCTTTV